MKAQPATHAAKAWPAVLVCAAGWAALLLLDGRIDLANQALLLVLTAAVAALWLPLVASVLANAGSVAAFNWLFVPPRGSMAVDLRQHAVMLGAMLLVNAVIAGVMVRLRRQVRRADQQARQARQLRDWGETLRDSDDPWRHLPDLQALLARLSGGPAVVMALRSVPMEAPATAATGALTDALPDHNDRAAVVLHGQADDDGLAGLWHCLRQGRPLGPGSGHFEELQMRCLPLRGTSGSLGAVLLRGPVDLPGDDEPGHTEDVAGADGAWMGAATDGAKPANSRSGTNASQLQALCDQMGLALQRAQAGRTQQRTRDEAQAQAVRNALLAAISHDYRTPLATILGAATSLQAQADRLDSAQRQRLALTIVDETRRLARLTDNTLQLARLDAPGVTLRCDWESAEEIVGHALRQARQHDPARRVRARLEPGLPLLWCDALLIGQMLDNLVDNALKYSPAGAPVELLVQRQDDHVLLAVRDRGPGIAPAWRGKVFEVFRRGAAAPPGPATPGAPDAIGADRPGAGVGLAVCRAIARAHGGELRLRPRSHGGSSFECRLPAASPPGPATAEPGDPGAAEPGLAP